MRSNANFSVWYIFSIKTKFEEKTAKYDNENLITVIIYFDCDFPLFKMDELLTS